MGNNMSKLTYLSETKNLIRNKMIDAGCEVSEEDTFRSYAEKIDTLSSVNYIQRAIEGSPKIEHTILGDIELSEHDFCAPRIIYPNVNEIFEIPFAAYYPVNGTLFMALFHNIIMLGDDVTVTCNIRSPYLGGVVFPSNVELGNHTIYTNRNDVSLSIGLGFGRSIKDSNSSWISANLYGSSYSKKIVKVEKDFKMTSGKTFYLNRLNITQDCMKELVQNLYDYIGNGETTEATRTICVGSINKSLLTDDEIQEALDKGWKITT